tara:strand:- start:32 stop:895 length:864 start_codon:yes stop_codon:yes gene_type:complete
LVKKISYIFYLFVKFLDNIVKFIFNRSFLVWFKEFLEIDSYKSIVIFNKKINFFIPNQTTKWRVHTYFSKEPETLEWIESFKNNEKIIFWDIGSNIGLYSIYAALKHSNIEIISFEPSTSNLRVLSRNISINKLEKKIKICQIPLSDQTNSFQMMNEERFIEGAALNSFGKNEDFEGKKFSPNNKYQLLGTTINSIIDSNTLEIPNYIKIDVDGIEHFILKGADKYLKNKILKSMSIEINENYKEQFEIVMDIMKKNDFKVLHKKEAYKSKIIKEFDKMFNYIFIRV